MLMPKRVKHRKQHRGHRRGKASGGTVVSFGDYGLQAMESCWMTANQIEAARIAMNRYIKRQGKIWIRIFPDKPFTKKPAETRMGSGKGAPDGWVAVIKPGRMLFEMGGGVTEAIAREAMRLASHKLPIETKFVKRDDKPAQKLAPTAMEEDTEITEHEIAAEAVENYIHGRGAETKAAAETTPEADTMTEAPVETPETEADNG